MYTWEDGELVTAAKLNAYGEGLEQIKTDAESAKTAAAGSASAAAGSAEAAETEAQRAEDAVAHNPTIQNGVWYVWNPDTGAYASTGVQATGQMTVQVTYQQGDSATIPPTGTWVSEPPEVAQGKYLWTKTLFSDSTIAYSVARQGVDGSGAVVSVNGKSGAVTLTAEDVDGISKVASATANNIPTLTSEGQLQDSGKTVDDLIDVFIVNLTHVILDGTVERYTSDKTFAEILAAHTAGKVVQLIYNGGDIGRLVSWDAESAVFEVKGSNYIFAEVIEFVCYVDDDGNTVWIRDSVQSTLPSPTFLGVGTGGKIPRISQDGDAWETTDLMLATGLFPDGSGGYAALHSWEIIWGAYDANTPISFVLFASTEESGLQGRLVRIENNVENGVDTKLAVFKAYSDATDTTYICTCTYNGADADDTWTVETTNTVLTGTLAAGSTSLVLQNSAIAADSTIDIYTDKWGVNPTDVTVETGKITLTFDAQDSALAVKVEVR